MSPTFTSGKLKGMMDPMGAVIDRFLAHIDKAAEKGTGVAIKTLFEGNAALCIYRQFKRIILILTYTPGLALDVIARCAFSIESDATSNPNQEIVREGRRFFSFLQPTNWLEMLVFTVPAIYFPFSIKMVDPFPDAIYNLHKITSSVMDHREKQGIQGTDFVGRLIELKKEVVKNPDTEYNKPLNDDIITAQGSIFFAAGFETTSNTLSTLSYELATRPELQERIYNEIKDVVKGKFDGEVTHEAIEKMEYLEATVNENLRLNAPLIVHSRVCMKDCEVRITVSNKELHNADTFFMQIAPGMLIKKGMKVEMPIYASHHDETFFPHPSEFRPERFLKENSADIIPFTYRPFGGEIHIFEDLNIAVSCLSFIPGGPRQCIAQRFALNEIKMTVAKLIYKYRLVATEKTRLDFSGTLFFLNYPGLEVKVEKREGE